MDDETVGRLWEQILSKVSDSVESLALRAPLTTLQIGLGLGLSFSGEQRHWLFHRTLLYTKPLTGSLKAVTQFFVIGDSLWGTLGSALSLALVQGQLEPALETLKTSNSSTASQKDNVTIATRLKESSLSPYLLACVYSGSFLLAFDVLIGGFPILSAFQSSHSSFHSRLYTLFPALDTSMQWLLAFVSGPRPLSSFSSLLGPRVLDLQVHPVWLPLLSMVFGGRQGWRATVSGFLAALFTAHCMDLKMGKESVVQSTLRELYRALRAGCLTLKRIYHNSQKKS